MTRTDGMITTTTVNDRLGYTLRTDFITDKLKIKPDGKDKAASLFTEATFVAICEALQVHNAKVQAGEYEGKRDVQPRIPKKPKKGKPAAAAAPTVDPLDEGMDEEDDDGGL